jgi:membrane fusion protein, multidrug efflux system
MVHKFIDKLKKKDKQSQLIALALIIVFVGFVVGWVAHNFFNRESTDDAFIDGHIIAISPKVSGHIAQVYITDNQKVKQGEALFDIDDSDYMVSLDLAQAEAKAAQAAAEQAQNDFKRYEQLQSTGDISEQQYDQAMFNLHSVQAKYEAAQARLKQAELNVSYTKVTAPVAGEIARKNVEQGAYVQAGQALAAIVSPERWVTANFKETQLTHIRAGQKVTIKIDTYPSMVLFGHIDSIQEGTGSRFSLLPAENATGNFIKVVQRVPVKIVFDTP